VNKTISEEKARLTKEADEKVRQIETQSKTNADLLFEEFTFKEDRKIKNESKQFEAQLQKMKEEIAKDEQTIRDLNAKLDEEAKKLGFSQDEIKKLKIIEKSELEEYAAGLEKFRLSDQKLMKEQAQKFEVQKNDNNRDIKLALDKFMKTFGDELFQTDNILK
jgi:uncharacterized protein with von Willebrand factor type A (vWA) domain